MNFPKRASIISLMKKTAINLTDGPILRSIITFAIPIVISNIFQQLYNTADIMIVGRFLGQDALAAVGATAAIFELIVGFALGVGNGMGVIIARYYGANNHRLLKRAVSATIVIGAVLSLLVATIGFFGMYPLLEFLGTPASIIDQSYAYISIIVLGIAVTFAYNLCAGLLRAVGDSQAALYFLIFSAVANIFLDILLITTFNMGVEAAAIATIIAQAISAVLCFIYIKKRASFLIPAKSDFVRDDELYLDLISQGLAMGLMSSIVSLGSVMLQSSINALGPVIISAQTSARRIFAFSTLPFAAIAAAMTTFTSQNFGANKVHRIAKGIRQGSLLAFGWAILVCIILFFASPFLNELVSGSSDPLLLDNAALYNRIGSLFYVPLALLLILRNSLQGLGQKVTPLVSSFIELAGKVLFVVFVIPQAGYLGVIFAEPIIWCLMAIYLSYAFLRHPLIKEVRHEIF